MGLGILLIQVMAVVGGNQWERQLREKSLSTSLTFNAPEAGWPVLLGRSDPRKNGGQLHGLLSGRFHLTQPDI